MQAWGMNLLFASYFDNSHVGGPHLDLVKSIRQHCAEIPHSPKCFEIISSIPIPVMAFRRAPSPPTVSVDIGVYFVLLYQGRIYERRS